MKKDLKYKNLIILCTAYENYNFLKEIGSSLEAEVKLSVDKNKFDLLENLDLSEYLITSKAEKVLSEDKEMKIEVNKAKGNKCPRCWKILEQSCDRCASLI